MFAPNIDNCRETSRSENTVTCRMATSAATPRRMARTLVAIAAGRSHSSFQTRVRRFIASSSVRRGLVGRPRWASGRADLPAGRLAVLAVGIVAALASLVQRRGHLILRGGEPNLPTSTPGGARITVVGAFELVSTSRCCRNWASAGSFV